MYIHTRMQCAGLIQSMRDGLATLLLVQRSKSASYPEQKQVLTIITVKAVGAHFWKKTFMYNSDFCFGQRDNTKNIM